MKRIVKLQNKKTRETLFIELKNDGNYFSITGVLLDVLTAAEKPERVGDDHWIMCGCLHDEILKWAPDYEDIIRLHLSSTVDGSPMYAYENGKYWAMKALNGEVSDSGKDCADILTDHLRISKEETRQLLNELKDLPNLAQFDSHFIQYVAKQYDRWKAEGDAITAKYFTTE